MSLAHVFTKTSLRIISSDRTQQTVGAIGGEGQGVCPHSALAQLSTLHWLNGLR